MTADNRLSRRSFLGGMGIAGASLFLEACTRSSISVNPIVPEVANPTAALSAQESTLVSAYVQVTVEAIQTNEASKQAAGMSPTPGVTATLEATATEFPTLTATPSMVPSPTFTSTPEATATPSVEEVRTELLGDPTITSWDAGRSLPPTPLSSATMALWDIRISQEKILVRISSKEVRTHDQIAEFTADNPNGAGIWSLPSLTETKSFLAQSETDPQTTYAWVDLDPATGNFPKAYQSAEVLWRQATDILANLKVIQADGSSLTLGESGERDRRIYDLYAKMRAGLMGTRGDKDSSVIFTRNTYPQWGFARAWQNEGEICSVYTHDEGYLHVPDRGEEYLAIVSGQEVLVESGEADFAFVFRLAKVAAQVDDPSRIVNISVNDSFGETWHLQIRLFDLWSQPQILGNVPSDPGNKGWGSQVLPHCGPGAKEQPKPTNTRPAQGQPQLSNTSGPGPTQTPGQPGETSTPGQPTDTPRPPDTDTPHPESTTPAPAPTNEHNSTATSGVDPTDKPKPSQVP